MREIDNVISDETIQKFVDGELSEDQFLEIQEIISSNPAVARRVEEYQQITTLVSGLHRSALSEPLPDRLRADQSSSYRFRQIIPVAAGLILFLVGMLAGWQISPGTSVSGEPDLINAAAAAHKLYTGEILHPVEVQGNDATHLQKWLTKRIGLPVNLPDVEKDGFKLLGGRLLPGDRLSPHGLLIYEKDNGERISVYITRTDDREHTTTLFEERDGLGVFYWIDEDLSCAVVVAVDEDFDHDNALRITNDIYEQLETVGWLCKKSFHCRIKYLPDRE